MTELTSANRAARSAAAFWGWALRETATALPGSLARLGATGRAALVQLDRAGAPGPAQGARRSLFARWRHGGAPGGRTVALLSPDAVLRRRVDLPRAAAGDPQQAVRLRLDSLCPIPLQGAAFAVRPLGPSGDGGLTADLAIVRKSDLERAVAAASARGGDWCVAADFDPHGPALVFADGAPAGRPSRWLMAALALAGVAAAYAAADARIMRDIATFEDARAALLAQSRALQAPDGSAQGAAPAQARLAAYPGLTEALAGLAEARPPEDAPVEQVRINQRSGVIVLEDGGSVAFELPEAGS